jgi:hypothetical protein
MLYSDLDERVKNEELQTYYIGGIYAHNKLHEILEYDLVVTDDKQLYNLRQNPVDDKMILFSDIEDKNKNIYKTKMYLWKQQNGIPSNKYIGLICLLDDVEGIQDAEDKYNRMEQAI